MRSRELARLVKDAATEHMEWMKGKTWLDWKTEWEDESPYVYVDRDGIRDVCFPCYLLDHRPPLAAIDVVSASTITIAEITDSLVEQFWMQEHD